MIPIELPFNLVTNSSFHAVHTGVVGKVRMRMEFFFSIHISFFLISPFKFIHIYKFQCCSSLLIPSSNFIILEYRKKSLLTRCSGALRNHVITWSTQRYFAPILFIFLSPLIVSRLSDAPIFSCRSNVWLLSKNTFLFTYRISYASVLFL